MNNQKPKIGVTGPDNGGESAWLFTRFAVWLQGGKAIRITPSTGRHLDEVELDGLILGGGADINPEHYGAELLTSESQEKPRLTGYRQWLHYVLSILLFPFLFLFRWVFSIKRSKLMDTTHGRDELELTLLQEALKRELPILGICRGAQLINVQFGGSLYQDISSFYSEVPQVYTVWPEKKVQIETGSRLYEIIKSPTVWVNALHRQAVDKVGSELRVVAREDNGVVQAIEHPNYPFLIGLQWHPEYMPQIPFQRELFKMLVDKARTRRQRAVEKGKSTVSSRIQIPDINELSVSDSKTDT